MGDDDGSEMRLRRAQLLLDTQARLNEQVLRFRSSMMLTYVAILVGMLLVERFLYLASRELLFIWVVPGLVVVGAFALDRFHYNRMLPDLAARAQAYVDRGAARGGTGGNGGGPSPSQAVSEHDAELAEIVGSVAKGTAISNSWLTAYYLVPLLVAVALLVWRFAG